MKFSDVEPEDELYERLASYSALPFLFLGSGISMRYLGLPTWEGLLKEFSDRAGLNYQINKTEVDGDLPKLASRISESFYQHWYNDVCYAKQRENYPDVFDKEEILKIAVAAYLDEVSEENLRDGDVMHDVKLRAELEKLKSVIVNGVITTNYDNFTDLIFPKFEAYVGQDELLLGDAQFVGEVYKIHGSVSQPSTLVLTEKDYDKLQKSSAYLVSKLLTIFVEHPIIFVGYRLSDQYIIRIFDELLRAVGHARFKEMSKRIFFVAWSDSIKESSIKESKLLRGEVMIPITQIETSSFLWLWNVLSRLERKFPAHMLRELKHHLYRIVTEPTEDEQPKVRAISMEDERSQDIKYVYGIAQLSAEQLKQINSMGAFSPDLIAAQKLSREHIYDDVLGIKALSANPDFILGDGIMKHIEAKNTEWIPVHKYLVESDRVGKDGKINYDGLHSNIQTWAEKTLDFSDEERRRFENVMQDSQSVMVADLMGLDKPLSFKLLGLQIMVENGCKLSLVEKELQELWREHKLKKGEMTAFRKALCAYSQKKWLGSK